jgi:hypothetical protein
MAAGSTGGRIAPLTNSQKLFLQRLLAMHVVTDIEARRLYASIKDKFKNVAPPPSSSQDDDDDGHDDGVGDHHGYLGDDLDHALGIINASLVPAFELEIRTVSLPPPYVEDDGGGGNDEDDGGGRGGRRKRQKLVRYHCVANRIDDASSRSHAYPASRGGAHEMAYFRLALERIVERGNEIIEAAAASADRDGDDDGAGGGVGCPGAMNRMDLINLRTELDGAHGDKLTIERTEIALGGMIEEGWLVRVSPPGGGGGGGGGGDADDDDEDEEDEDEDEERRSTAKAKRKRKKSGGGRGGRRRSSSLRGTYYGIGPRSFMEMGEFLQKAGLPGDRMPQSILHRV